MLLEAYDGGLGRVSQPTPGAQLPPRAPRARSARRGGPCGTGRHGRGLQLTRLRVARQLDDTLALAPYERPDDSMSEDDVDIEAWQDYAKVQQDKAKLSTLTCEWREKESGREELVLFSLDGVEKTQHAGETIRTAQALMATTLAHCAEAHGREAELQQELDALRRQVSMTQKSIMDYVNVTAPKEAVAAKIQADTVRFASGLADETDELAARVAELQSENLSKSKNVVLL
eukprot:COSAG06_NODE_22230_length_730_cov_1.053883_1_plen_230_part_01